MQGFNEQGATNLLESFLTPISNTLLWAIPVAAGAACMLVYLQWLGKDEMEREHSPYGRSIKKIVIGAVIAYGINGILNLFYL